MFTRSGAAWPRVRILRPARAAPVIQFRPRLPSGICLELDIMAAHTLMARTHGGAQVVQFDSGCSDDVDLGGEALVERRIDVDVA